MPKTPTPPACLKAKPPPRLHHNWEDWLPFLADEDITEAEKRQHIEVLWSIVIAFVDLGWNVTSGAEVTGELEGELGGQDIDLTTLLRAAMLDSETRTEPEEA